ncbi:hypothetical protein Cylst_5221 [Cylindrospermum stagnale PCC 7417]|uniref:Uncharacterized protein n=1 Tax=Cylindrospermum stagnale PCC 7417 TaxID=56107 RepID=K9X3M6_9NOST|nr:hypothetical protein [Cylindrospermum stagnale]AFZ27255.1 hypothetical protein Cylst_5221 [Cylindrospermum stagnale PCC 7417]
MEDRVPLFSGRQLGSVLLEREQQISQDIEETDSNTLLNTSVEDWCDYYENHCKFEILQLKDNEIRVDQEEALVPVTNFYRGLTHEQGTKFIYFISFEGEQELFRYQPSVYIGDFANPLTAKIYNGELILEYPEWQPEVTIIQSRFKHDLSNIQEHINFINRDILTFNNSIRAKVKPKIENRRQKLLKAQELVTALGYPLKQRDNMPQTYIVPTVQRKLIVTRPSANTTSFVPEPDLEMKEYEHILSVITNMVMVMERSPKAFQTMEEEHLRQHFLVQLNGHYEGQATGETFNGDGKTDILIRVNGRNIFIAECKFWRGDKGFQETIEQLLGYTKWRDTKTALIIFNRNKDFTAVVQQIPTIIKSHSNFKRELSCNFETGFRCMLHNRDDVNREFILTTLAFDVPTK